MASYKYSITENSGELGVRLEDSSLIIGDRVLKALNSDNPARVTGARKRFMHEWWHIIFANLSKENQKKLLEDLQHVIEKEPHTKELVLSLCERMYKDESYSFHFVSPENDDLFVNDGFGLKVRDSLSLEGPDKNYEVYGALLLTEILSLSSESEIPDVEGYYKAVEPKNHYEHTLWENKKELGRLSREVVSSMQTPLLDNEFKAKTEQGLELLEEISEEYQELNESKSEISCL